MLSNPPETFTLRNQPGPLITKLADYITNHFPYHFSDTTWLAIMLTPLVIFVAYCLTRSRFLKTQPHVRTNDAAKKYLKDSINKHLS